MEPSLLSAEVISLLVVILGFLNETKVNPLGSRLNSTHQEVSTDPSTSSDLSLHKKLSFVSFLISVPDIGILWHSESLYHNGHLLFLNLYISI